MEYVRPQLMEDMHSNRVYESSLSREQREFLKRIERPQLQQDVYEGITSQILSKD